MIDFSRLRKYIYFPRKNERKLDPYVIFVLDKWGSSWRGNVDSGELLARKFQFFSDMRCQPYSDELWEACLEWKERRKKLHEDFDWLRVKGVKSSGSK